MLVVKHHKGEHCVLFRCIAQGHGLVVPGPSAGSETNLNAESESHA